MDLATRRWRRSLFLFFFLTGLAISSWVTRTPDIRDRLGASTAEMGIILLGLSAGSMTGILSSGPLVNRFGTRPVIGVGNFLVVVSVTLVGCGSLASWSPVVFVGLLTFGAGMGSAEVATNVDGVEIERITGTTVMPTLHGCFSLGTVVGAVCGIAATAQRLPAHWHLLAVTCVSLTVFLYAIRAVPSGTGVHTRGSATREAPDESAREMWRDSRLLLIGVIVLAMALAEGAANDWLPLLMVDGHGLDAAQGSLVYAGFAAAMTLGRFSGSFFLDRFGRAMVVRAGAVSGAIGVLLVVFADSALLAGAAVLFWGLGASLGFPVALSAASDSGPNATARVSLVATIGYVAFLVGPPSLGFLGEHYGLRTAMLVVLACVTLAIFIAPAAGDRSSSAVAAGSAHGDEPAPERRPERRT
ncbi:MFS transporter [Streptomyces hygroscopicus]|uniref:MFS transporter n=1 Tax=Streptomyces hygroscopicus TaxID=1912 RepID=UPI00367631D2